jgi:hypothetical protein
VAVFEIAGPVRLGTAGVRASTVKSIAALGVEVAPESALVWVACTVYAVGGWPVSTCVLKQDQVLSARTTAVQSGCAEGAVALTVMVEPASPVPEKTGCVVPTVPACPPAGVGKDDSVGGVGARVSMTNVSVFESGLVLPAASVAVARAVCVCGAPGSAEVAGQEKTPFEAEAVQVAIGVALPSA